MTTTSRIPDRAVDACREDWTARFGALTTRVRVDGPRGGPRGFQFDVTSADGYTWVFPSSYDAVVALYHCDQPVTRGLSSEWAAELVTIGAARHAVEHLPDPRTTSNRYAACHSLITRLVALTQHAGAYPDYPQWHPDWRVNTLTGQSPPTTTPTAMPHRTTETVESTDLADLADLVGIVDLDALTAALTGGVLPDTAASAQPATARCAVQATVRATGRRRAPVGNRPCRLAGLLRRGGYLTNSGQADRGDVTEADLRVVADALTAQVGWRVTTDHARRWIAGSVPRDNYTRRAVLTVVGAALGRPVEAAEVWPGLHTAPHATTHTAVRS